MATNPFEDEHRPYLVLTNHEDQHSLWPADLAVPDGWTAGFGPAERAACLAHIDTSWTDLRPASARPAPSTAG
jgi:MbtH protein